MEEITREPERTLIEGLSQSANKFIEGILTNDIDLVFVDYRPNGTPAGFRFLTKQGEQDAYFCEGHHSGYAWSPPAQERINHLRNTIECFIREQGHTPIEGGLYCDDERPGIARISFAIYERYKAHQAERTRATFERWFARVANMPSVPIHCSFAHLNYADPPGTDRGDASPWVGGYSLTVRPQGGIEQSFYGSTTPTAQWLLSRKLHAPMPQKDAEKLQNAILNLLTPLPIRLV